jgi:hypothetical protein
VISLQVPEYSPRQLTCIARNLKFYPLALKRAADNEPCLAHIAANFKATLCTGRKKLLADCDAWDLLNLTPNEVASLITNISVTFGLSAPALQTILNNYLIQTTGKDDLEKYFEIQQPPQYMCPKTAHYSWPKGAGESYIESCIQGVGVMTTSHSCHWHWVKKHNKSCR